MVLHRQEIDGRLEVFCVDVRGGHVPGLDKGLLDFAVLCGLPNERRYEHLLFPEADYFGLVMRGDDCLAGRGGIRVGDLVGLPLFCSEQSWEGDIRPWAKERFGELRLEGSVRQGGPGVPPGARRAGRHLIGKRARVPTAFTGAGGSALLGLGQAPDPHSYRKALSGSAASCVCRMRKRGPFCALSRRPHSMIAPARPLG